MLGGHLMGSRVCYYSLTLLEMLKKGEAKNFFNFTRNSSSYFVLDDMMRNRVHSFPSSPALLIVYLLAPF